MFFFIETQIPVMDKGRYHYSSHICSLMVYNMHIAIFSQSLLGSSLPSGYTGQCPLFPGATLADVGNRMKIMKKVGTRIKFIRIKKSTNDRRRYIHTQTYSHGVTPTILVGDTDLVSCKSGNGSFWVSIK